MNLVGRPVGHHSVGRLLGREFFMSIGPPVGRLSVRSTVGLSVDRSCVGRSVGRPASLVGRHSAGRPVGRLSVGD